ncbi:MAG: RHS repeat-associated core domain-containing protein [Acidobacteriota bacterium]
MRLRRYVRTLWMTTIALGCALAVAQAQQLDPAAKPDRGVTQSGSYALSDIENVNLTNGNVNISMPLASLPPIAGGKLSWSIRAAYNSKLWDMKSFKMQPDENHAQPWEYYVNQRSDSGGWLVAERYWVEQLFADYDAEVDCGDPSDPQYGQCQSAFAYRYKMVLHTPDGATHELRPLDAEAYTGIGNQTWRRGFYAALPVNTPMRYYSYDGSFLWAVIYAAAGNVDWIVYMPDGTSITQLRDPNHTQQITDTNGNKVEIISTTNLSTGDIATICTDVQTGRQISYNYTAGNETGLVRYKTVGGTLETITIHFATKTLTGKAINAGDRLCGNWGTILGEDFKVITSIVLPQSEPDITRQFSFEYNSDTIDTISPPIQFRPYCGEPVQPISTASRGLGELSRVTLPSGASADYVYKQDGNQTGPLGLSNNRFACRLVSGNSLKQKTLVHDGVSTDIWNYTITSVSGQVTGPDGLLVKEDFFQKDSEYGGSTGGTTGFEGLVYRTTRSMASNNQKVIIEERRWEMKKFDTAVDDAPNGHVAFNPVVTAEFTTLCNDVGIASQMSAKKFQYDFNGNQTSASEYDFFNPGSVTPDTNGVPLDVPGSASPVRTTTTTFYTEAPLGSSTTVYAKRLIGSATPVFSAPKLSTVGGAQTEFHYDGLDNTAPSKANLTKARQFVEGTTWIQTTHTYDTHGNRLTSTDPKGNITTWVYDTVILQPISVTVDPNNQVSGDVLTTETEYDTPTGLVTKVRDANDNETTYDYKNQLLSTPSTPVNDPFGRPGLVTDPVGRTILTLYHDDARQVETKADLKTVGDGLLRSMTTHDNLGRVIKVEGTEYTSAYTLITDTVYEKMGRVTYTNNPHRSGTLPTDGWTRTKTDEIGRVVEVATFDGATRPEENATNWNGRLQTSYNAEETTVTDQAGKQRKSVVDGLGRLVRVFEDPAESNLQTDYEYDALGNLLQVDQVQGQVQQHRIFTYDGLSRLLTAKNPEQVNASSQMVETTYAYDNASNLLSKTGPNPGVSVSFIYDGLNRVKRKTLSGGNVWEYAYDTPGDSENGKGRLTSVVVQGGTDGYYYDDYDSMGRVTKSRQITTAGTSNSYTMMYEYDLAGNLIQQTYPSGKVFVTEYDDAGRIAGVKRGTSYYAGGSPTDATNRIQYEPHGAIRALKLGNGKWEHTLFNGRLQPMEIGLGATSAASDLLKLEYTYSTTGQANNNGNVRTQTITAPKTQSGAGNLVLTQNYSYDALNRLSFAEELIGALSQWNQTYDIDRWGNRAVNNTSTYIPSPGLTPQSLTTFDTATNRIKPSEMAGIGYDTSGNLTSQPNAVSGTDIMVYDAENHQTSYTKAGAGTTSYSYDGDGHRVKRTDPDNNTTIFVYNAGGQLIAEYTSGTPSGGGTSYLTSDHLGSTRVVTKADGSVKARYDYLPFGEEIDTNHGSRSLVTGYGASEGTRQKFTQKERDSESGLDYFGARYYSSPQGRFTSVDPHNIILEAQATAEVSPQKAKAQFLNYLASPQQWNHYSYVANNPLVYIDPTGEILELTGSEEERKRAFERVKELVGSKAAGSLYVREENGHYFVETNNAAAVDASGKVGVVVNDIISSSTLVQFRVSSTTVTQNAAGETINLNDKGGGYTGRFVRGGKSFIQIIVDVNADVLAASGARRNGAVGDNGKPLRYFNDVADAHEFGHAYFYVKNLTRFENAVGWWQFWKRGDTIGGLIEQSKGTSVDVENWARERRGLNKRTAH